MFLLAGYVVGVAVGSGPTSRLTGVVQSYDSGSDELCLGGDEVSSAEGADGDRICGTWRRNGRARVPEEGDEFRFVSIRPADDPDDDADTVRVLIYGDVVAS